MRDEELGYTRTTISVPLELKRRMEAAGTRVNWSAVACDAFAAKLAELSKHEEVRTVDEVVERLRRLKNQSLAGAPPGGPAGAVYGAGADTGRQWAMSTAGPDQLERVEAFRTRYTTEDEWARLFQQRDGWQELARVVEPRCSGEEKKYLKRLLGEQKPGGPDFFRGFADGALYVWRQVKDKI